MGFWVSFFVSLALTVIGELLRPKQKFNDPKPSALGDFQFPTADSTRVIQCFWGTCKIAGPNTVWFGDLSATKKTKKVKTGWFSSTRITLGFNYYLGVQLVYGYGKMDELLDFRIDDKSVFGSSPNTTPLGGFDGNAAGWLSGLAVGASYSSETCVITNFADYYAFTMNSPTLLGNDELKEGVAGPVKIYKGTFTQPANDYLTTQWAEPEGSGFRPLLHAVLEHCYLGNSDTPPPVTLIARRTPNPIGLTLGRENIKGDANPANMCYEVMTDLIFGMKIAPSKIDTDGFIAVGNTLATEELGLSMSIETAMKGKDLLAEILRHVDGVIYPDPRTGLYTMKLARDDYDVNTIPVFDKSNIDATSFEFSRISWEDTKNTTVVNYTDRYANFVPKPVTHQDLANVFVRKGQIDSEQIDFLGFSRADQAAKVAARANKTRSSPLSRVSFNTDRTGYALRPSSVIKISMPDFGITELIARVIDINYGTLDDPAVKVVCTEDIFAVNSIAYSPPGGGGFIPPGADPLPLLAQKLLEAPHFGAADNRAYVFTMAARAGAFDLGYEVWSDPTGGTAYEKTNVTPDFTPMALLTSAMAINTADTGLSLTINTGVDMTTVDPGPSTGRDDGLNLVLIGNEILAWQSLVDNGGGSYTLNGVYRGVLDTLAEAHSAGDQVWFFSEGVAVTDPDGYPVNVTVQAKLLTANSRGTLPIASATASSVTTSSRSLRPLPPGKIRINAIRPYDLIGTVTGSFALAWAHRNRNDSLILSQSADSATPEAGTLYNVRFYNAGTNALIIQKAGINATDATVALAFTGNVKMQIETVRDGVLSRVPQEFTFAYDAGGTTTSVITANETVYVLDGGAP